MSAIADRSPEFVSRKECRICGSRRLDPFLSLGPMPLANSFLRPTDLNYPESCYPLDVAFCPTCGLVQLVEVVSPAVMFSNYIYESSTSDTIPSHFAQLAQLVCSRLKLSKRDCVVEIGSNDGCLLKAFQESGVQVLGVEAAENISKVAVEAGVPTVNAFFDRKLAEEIVNQRGKVRVIVANNVVAHIDQLHDMVEGVHSLLTKKGLFIFEVPYLAKLITNLEYDTIYHEHMSYFSVRPLLRLFELHNLSVCDVQEVGVHGGSIRVFVGHAEGVVSRSRTVDRLLKRERRQALDDSETYVAFARRVWLHRLHLVKLVEDLMESGEVLAGYGAPAKGNTLLNFCRIGPDALRYIADKSKRKQGLFTPGLRVPVVGPERILEDPPQYLLLLAWNFAEEIFKQQAHYRSLGGKFIVPIPQLRIQ